MRSLTCSNPIQSSFSPAFAKASILDLVKVLSSLVLNDHDIPQSSIALATDTANGIGHASSKNQKFETPYFSFIL